MPRKIVITLKISRKGDLGSDSRSISRTIDEDDIRDYLKKSFRSNVKFLEKILMEEFPKEWDVEQTSLGEHE